MRESCLECVSKHLAKAVILLSEARLGYRLHKYLAFGNLSEAEDEACRDYPLLAHDIRQVRLDIENDDTLCSGIKILALIQKVDEMIENEE